MSFDQILLGVAMAFVVAIPGDAVAQQREREDVQLRNDCRLAAQVLTTGRPATLRTWALDQLSVCDETAGAAIASAWASVANDSAELVSLRRSAAAVRDVRIWEATSEVARDPSRPLPVRLAALSLLPTFVDPSVRVHPSALQQPPKLTVLPRQFDYAVVEGAQPFPADLPDRVVAAVQELAASDSDPTVRAAAGWLSRALSLHLHPLPMKR